MVAQSRRGAWALWTLTVPAFAVVVLATLAGLDRGGVAGDRLQLSTGSARWHC